MTLTTFLEAVARLAAASKAFVAIEVVETTYYDIHTAAGTVRTGQHRATIQVLRPGGGSKTPVGTVDLDVNTMITKVEFFDVAPYWAVRPFSDAMEGK